MPQICSQMAIDKSRDPTTAMLPVRRLCNSQKSSFIWLAQTSSPTTNFQEAVLTGEQGDLLTWQLVAPSPRQSGYK